MKLPDYCPACLNDDCVIHVDLGDECDSDGTFGNHRLTCTKCGRTTCDMDTLEDAIEAWNGRDDTVHFEGADTVLLDMDVIIEMIQTFKQPPTKRELANLDIRNRVNC